VKQGYKEIFKGSKLENINVVFVQPKYIENLNKQYRGIDLVTDVLSFNLSSGDGEIYICPAYVYESFKNSDFEEEILRLIIHGTLHILGYNHKGSLNDSSNEEMFKLQEDLIIKYLAYVHSNRVRKSK
ncbi:MAG TPA: rRNA maturation RNase YbeY, partial [Candidatus Dojkabacteria bacterium]|nr:rRNA maturation RNase YbeY [Candidatus Dojkabacteria bacterium]